MKNIITVVLTGLVIFMASMSSTASNTEGDLKDSILMQEVQTQALQASTIETAIVEVENVFYDYETQNYCIYAVDKDNQGWVIDIVHAKKPNSKILKRLNKCYKDLVLLVTYDTINTADVTDDIILKYEIY